MSVDRNEVERIAELAKLDLDEAEAERLTEEMNRILEHAERLRGLDASGDERPAEATHSAGEAPPSVGDGGSPGVTSGPREGLGGPDPLVRLPGSFAPEMKEGFFTVPPPPGVVDSDRE